MWTSSNGNISALLALCRRSPVDSPHKGQWHDALLFSLIYAWTNGWTNNQDASDLRHQRAHYDVTVMWLVFCFVLLWFGTSRFYPYYSGLFHWHWSNHDLTLNFTISNGVKWVPLPLKRILSRFYHLKHSCVWVLINICSSTQKASVWNIYLVCLHMWTFLLWNLRVSTTRRTMFKTLRLSRLILRRHIIVSSYTICQMIIKIQYPNSYEISTPIFPDRV